MGQTVSGRHAHPLCAHARTRLRWQRTAFALTRPRRARVTAALTTPDAKHDTLPRCAARRAFALMTFACVAFFRAYLAPALRGNAALYAFRASRCIARASRSLPHRQRAAAAGERAYLQTYGTGGCVFRTRPARTYRASASRCGIFGWHAADNEHRV